MSKSSTPSPTIPAEAESSRNFGNGNKSNEMSVVVEETDDDEFDENSSKFMKGNGRRNSSSDPGGLDLLLHIAENSWKPKRDYFDKLADVEADFRERRRTLSGQTNSDTMSEYNSDLESTSSPLQIPESPTNLILLQPGNRARHRSFSSDEEEIYEFKNTALATRRKSGVVPLNISNSNYLKSDPLVEFDVEKEISANNKPQINSFHTFPTASNKYRYYNNFISNSATSAVNKIRDKFESVSVPAVFRRKGPSEYRLPAFVAILFLTIVLLIGSIYVIHNEKELRKGFFDQIRFSDKDRKFRVINENEVQVLSGILGINLSTKKDKPWPCLKEHQRENESCLEWMKKGRLHFQILNPGQGDQETSQSNNEGKLQCYGILWERLDPNFELKDCFDISEKKGFYWFGGGETPFNSYPLNRSFVPYLSPFITGNKISGLSLDDGDEYQIQWGRVLSRLFINSPGASIKISQDTPLHVSINSNRLAESSGQKNQMLCIAARFDEFAYPQSLDVDSKFYLNYTICAGANIRDVSMKSMDKSIWDGLRHDDVHSTYALVKSPIWKIGSRNLNNFHQIIQKEQDPNSNETVQIQIAQNLSEAALLNHTDRIAALHLSEGYILLDESWSRNIGDLEFDLSAYPNMQETLHIVHRRGFKIALTIHPFFNTESENYIEGLRLGLWTKERNRKTRVPTLTTFSSSNSAALLDITEPIASEWFEKKVSNLVGKYNVDGLLLDVGSAQDLPHYYEFGGEKLASADNIKEYFLKCIRRIKNVTIMGITSAVQLPKLPTFVSLSPIESSFTGLKSIIPNILNLGISGYPFIISGSIGGDYQLSLAGENSKPSRNLYIRWLELAHFLPVIQYTFLPSDYDEKVVEIASSMNLIRKAKLFPYIKKAIDESLTSGLPIIRPLWIIDPYDVNCLKISDEFMIGSDILVAPILYENSVERDIYLPKGKWRDELDGSNTKGEKWLHHYRVRENQIAFFTKLDM